VLLRFSPARIEHSIAGDEVATRIGTFGSQAEQIVYLRLVVEEYRKHHSIRQRARDVAFRQYGAEPRDQLAQAVALASWVQRNITYVNELPETFQTPTTTLATGYGDCDDQVQLLGALLESIGIMAELVGLWWEELELGRWIGAVRHIFVRGIVRVRGGGLRRVPLDTTTTSPVEELRDPVRIAQQAGARGLRLIVQ
jgi:transglutaminase-like putative cysteine protease